MIDPLANLIQEDDARWASQLMGLGPDAFSPVEGDDSRLRAMLSLETADFEACPGSGKTTLLVAKLAILATRWPYRQRGICVLSHTNAARNEIRERLSNSAAGISLLRYPHFVGTIHSFVNEYLAIPWLRSKGNPVRMIDTQVALSKRMGSLERKWRFALQKSQLSEYALMYEATDYTGDKNKGKLGRNTDFYKRLVEAARSSSEQGYFCFDEMFVWANELLDKRPEAAYDLRARFPLVFIDEAQDNSEEQSALLHRIFCAGDSPSRRQRFGDSNQAIYAHNGQEGAATDRFPSGSKHDIPRSYRFCQAMADEVKGFGVAPQMLIGAGPTSAKIAAGPKAPVLFLFDDESVREVLPRYGAHLVSCFGERDLANGTYVAVAGVHELDKEDPIPRAMGHYQPSYDPACAKKESAPTSLIQYLARARVGTVKARNTHVAVDALASALLAVSDLLGKPHSGFNRRSPHKRLLDVLLDASAREAYLKLVDLVITEQGAFDVAAWTARVLPLVHAVVGGLSNDAALTDDAKAFLEWSPALVKEAREDVPGAQTSNHFDYPRDVPKVQIRLGSIHSVKGETHTATLVLDSYYHKHHLSELKPWLLGTRVGGSSAKKNGKVVMEGVRMLGRLKLHYVAMTRPSHLLCLAMRKDAFVEEELGILTARGWQIIDCSAPAKNEGGRP